MKNHGIPDEAIQAAYLAAQEFFALPDDIKMEVSITSHFHPLSCQIMLITPKIEYKKTPNLIGYSPLLSSNNDPNSAGDLMEGFEFGYESIDQTGEVIDRVHEGAMAGANVWPVKPPGFRKAALQY